MKVAVFSREDLQNPKFLRNRAELIFIDQDWYLACSKRGKCGQNEENEKY